MRQKHEVVRSIREGGLVAVIRTATPEQAEAVAAACAEAGVTALEITWTVPRATAVIERLRSQYEGSNVVVGAGSVLDAETARLALLAGAEFVVAPTFSAATARLCGLYQTLYVPGAGTTTEVATALESGADLIKVFPGEVLGAAFIRAVRGPLPQAALVPTGGVALDNVGDWIRAGAAALGVGGRLVGERPEDTQTVTRNARAFLARIQEARASLR